MLETRVEDFFDALPLGPPQISHVIETPVHRVESFIDTAFEAVEAFLHGIELRVDVGKQKKDHCRVDEQRYANRQIELLITHHYLHKYSLVQRKNLPADPQIYSNRSASIGPPLAARRAGK